ncbi:Helix-turn-helix domain-containing protein [Nocardia amikacinitolerans]|uniref:MmyB family transcriptional regulator n=1 Tax=Nocardia amikacinitolerans TaxID=756689 RepID=UPI0020A45BE8|nr:helix-turn-helix domain-containing protein [Nocardia amikacinitolerans]MCP2298356.1 Helix-turn-helix domain-containing protein [Nocardia amikacinitolerans]
MNPTTNPARRPRRRRQDRAGHEIPELGCWARRIRESHKLSRQRAAEHLHISKDMLKKIESGDAGCSPTVLNNLVATYDLDRAQERYTRDLARPPVPLPPLEELRARTVTVDRRAKLARLDDRDIAAAYIDPVWNLVLANQRFRAALPGVDEYGDNLCLWFFHPGSTAPTAEHFVIDHHSAATYLVATLRGALGRHRETPHARTLFQDLRGSALFSQLWDTSIALAYGRRPDDPIHLRDPTTGELYSARIQFGDAPGSPDARFWLCYRQPDSEPEST